MSTQKHTDGPWHITKETKFHTMGTFITVRDSHEGVIAGTHVNDKANAHLIAAAPELLAALKLALPCVEYAEIETASKGQNEAHDKCLTALEWIRAAIAKAEGNV